MTIRRRYLDSSRRTAVLVGGLVTLALVAGFFVHLLDLWRPFDGAWPWLVALIPAVAWVVHFSSTMAYELVVDDSGIARGRGSQLTRVRWEHVSTLVELSTSQRHLAVLSSRLPQDRSPGEGSLTRAFRLPGNGLVFQADDEVRAAVTERLGRPRPVREVVGP